MPEWPDVEAFNRHVQQHAFSHRIERTIGHDARILEGVTPSALGRRLKGRTFESTRRHGKVLFLALSDGGGFMVLHFGMTGNIRHCRKQDDAPKHTRAEIVFTQGSRLAIISQRLFGAVEWAEDADGYIEEHELGPDALDEAVTKAYFGDVIADSRGTVKATLMNQALIAGIGNIYSDEILFQAGIRPDRDALELTEKECAAIWRTMRRVLRTAADRIAKYLPDEADFPDGWLVPSRRKGSDCPRCGKELSSKKISGRTAWYCPHCQH